MAQNVDVMKTRKMIPCLMVLAGLCSCRTGPNYEAPTVGMPEQYDATGGTSGSAADSAWWDTFEDPVLIRCIKEAQAANHEVRMALQRVRSARALRRVESSRLLPDIGSGAAYTADRMSENNARFQNAVQAGVFPIEVDNWTAGFDVTWELDVFGGNRRRLEASVARLQEEEFRSRALQLSITAEVARNYIEIRGHQQQLELLNDQIRNESDRVKILRRKHASGLIPASETLKMESRLQQLQALTPPLQAEIRAGTYRLAVLLGRRPESSVEGMETLAPLPKSTGRVPLGLPSDLLRRRPDLMAAERSLAAATADIGVARAEFFPRFFLTGSPSLQSGDFSSLFEGASAAWTLGPSVSWKLFSAGRNRALLEAARARKEQVFIGYEASVNRALEEVESSLTRYGNNARALKFLEGSASAQKRAVEIQRLRLSSGIVGQLDVIEAVGTWIEARRRQVDQEVLLLTRLVNLYKVLGGGWEKDEAVALGSRSVEQEPNSAF